MLKFNFRQRTIPVCRTDSKSSRASQRQVNGLRPPLTAPPVFANVQPRGRQPKVLPPSFILQLNNRCPIAAHEAVSLKKICCFFCAHFWQIEKVSVLISEQGEIPVFYQAAGRIQISKRLIVGKDQAAGKVFVRKRGRTPARSLL